MGVCIQVRQYGSMFLRGTGVSMGINMGLPTVMKLYAAPPSATPPRKIQCCP